MKKCFKVAFQCVNWSVLVVYKRQIARLNGQLTSREPKMSCSPDSPLNNSTITRAVACYTVLLKPQVMRAKFLLFGQANWISSHSCGQQSQLRYDSLHLWRCTVQWCHQPINHPTLWHFLNALAAFAMLLTDLHAKGDISAYLCTNWDKNELTMKWKKRAMTRTHILIIKCNDLQALFICKALHS